VECAGQFKPLVEDRNHEVGAHRNPDLGLHRVGTRTVVVLDPEVALDPAEEQLDAPAQLVEHGHGKRGNFEMVGQEHEWLAGFQVEVFDQPQKHREVVSRFLDRGFAYVIAAQSGQSVHLVGVMPGEAQVGFGACDKEGTGIGDESQAGKIHVAAIHQVKRDGLEEQFVEPAHIVLPGPCNADANGNRASQVDLRVHLDSSLGLAKVRPVEERERQIDRGRIQGIDRVVQIDTEILADVKRPCLANEALGEVLPNPPVARFVGIGKCRSGDLPGEAKMIEGLGTSMETGGDIAQSIPGVKLGKHHADELLTKSKVSCGGVRFVFRDESRGRLPVNQIQNLRENITAAHVREASRARLDAEFISKLGGALQETDVTQLWLELLSEECRIQSSFTNPMHHESDELIAIMTTIIRKTNRGKTDGGKKVESRKQMKEKQRKAES